MNIFTRARAQDRAREESASPWGQLGRADRRCRGRKRGRSTHCSRLRLSSLFDPAEGGERSGNAFLAWPRKSGSPRSRQFAPKSRRARFASVTKTRRRKVKAAQPCRASIRVSGAPEAQRRKDSGCKSLYCTDYMHRELRTSCEKSAEFRRSGWSQWSASCRTHAAKL